jgi:ribosomal protein S12 methylthiotransferase
VHEPAARSRRCRARSRHRATSRILKISEGCDHRCTFCIIPYLRGDRRAGPSIRSSPEASALASSGVKELILIGQDTTGYGTDMPGPGARGSRTAQSARRGGRHRVDPRHVHVSARVGTTELIETLRWPPEARALRRHAAAAHPRLMLRKMARASDRAKTEKLLAQIRARFRT